MMRDIDMCDDDVPKVSSTAIVYSTTHAYIYIYMCVIMSDDDICT